MKKNKLIAGTFGAVGLVCLMAALGHPFAASKQVAKKHGLSQWDRAFGPSERLLARGDDAGALASLRAIQTSRNHLHAGEATREVAEILQRAGRPREAYDEYARLVLMTRGTQYANSRVSDGVIHARMAAIAFDLEDGALFGRAVRDLASQMRGTLAQIGEESGRRQASLPGKRGDEAARRFEAQTQDIREAAGAPPLVTMARALAQDGDIAHRDRLYEIALQHNPNPRLLKEYGDDLDATHQPRAALRIFSQIPTPYPKDEALSIEEALRTLPWRVARESKMTEAQEEKEAIQKLARLRNRVWSPVRSAAR